MRFEIVAGDRLIGWTELESGDPPMGVATGRFYPSDSYVRPLDPETRLRVRPEGGAFLEHVAGVHVEDYSADLGPEAIEVSVLGIDSDTYQRLFPQHVRAYEGQFREMDGKPMLRPVDVEQLLNELCTGLGFCLAEEARRALRGRVPSTPAMFADAVLTAEGLQPELVDRHLYRRVLSVATDAFERAAQRDVAADEGPPCAARRPT